MKVEWLSSSLQSLFIIFRLNPDVFFLGWLTNLFSHSLTARNLLHLWSCSVSKHTYIRYLDQSIRVIPNLVPKEIRDFIGFSLLPTVIGQENSQTIKYNLDWVSLSCAWVPIVGYVRYFNYLQFIIFFFAVSTGSCLPRFQERWIYTEKD